MRLIAEVPGIAFFHLMGIQSRFFSLFLVEEGAEMMVESTIVPFFRISPAP